MVVVTGSSRGIGAAIAAEFARHGAAVAVGRTIRGGYLVFAIRAVQ